MSFLEQFPDRATLLESYQSEDSRVPLKVNNHIHTPYSFSAFSSIEEAVRMADEEDVKILGINDFYVTDGHEEFIDQCFKFHIFPLLNFELIGISREDQESGIRVNDPGNPGRTYITGKGLAFPSILQGEQLQKLDRVLKESNKQVAKMIDLLNRWLEFQRVDITLSVKEIMEEHAMDSLRERHVAKALRIKIDEKSQSDDEFYKLLAQSYGGKSSEKQNTVQIPSTPKTGTTPPAVSKVEPKKTIAAVKRKPEQKPKRSTLDVKSAPPGAGFYLNGEYKGRTPLKVPLPYGKYEVRLQHEKYYGWEAQVNLDKPGEIPLHVRLIPED